jgi:hypothetical protein
VALGEGPTTRPWRWRWPRAWPSGVFDDDVLARYPVWARPPKDIGATVSHALARASTPQARAAPPTTTPAGGHSAGTAR